MGFSNNLVVNEGGYDFASCMGFVGEAPSRAYFSHSHHEKLLNWLVPRIDTVDLDLPPG